MIGDPPNIMIGSAVKELTFMAFIVESGSYRGYHHADLYSYVYIPVQKTIQIHPRTETELAPMDRRPSNRSETALETSTHAGHYHSRFLPASKLTS